jgi:hypothetical protein
MDTQRRIGFMELALTRQLKTNFAADTKVSTLIGIDTTMLAVLAALITRTGTASPWVIALVALSASGLLIGLLFLSLSSVPRTSRTNASIVFFGSIASMGGDAYGEAVRTITEQEYLDDLIRQTHRTAEIATQKYRWIQRAQLAWYLSILPWLLAVYGLAG